MGYLGVFYIVQVIVSWYAFGRGGAPERVVASAMLCAALSTTVVTYFHREFSSVHTGELVVDLVFMAVLVAVAGRADRLWPMHVAALHLLGVGVHAVRAFDPMVLPVVYARAQGTVAYPMLLFLVVGTFLHYRRSRRGIDVRDWVPFKW